MSGPTLSICYTYLGSFIHISEGRKLVEASTCWSR